MSVSPFSQFNKTYDEFMSKLKKVIPDEPRLWTLHDAFSTGKKANPRMPVEMWINTVHPYAFRIFQKDEDFFLKNDEIKDAVGNAEGFNTLDSLSSLWNSGVQQKTKEAIWMYLANLCIISYMYLGIDVSFDETLLNKVLETCDYYLSQEYKAKSHTETIVKSLKEKFNK
tara:strand:+ start:299 stop:808 length:510 start_codon:yes stop_codon:yes gene_type:complete